MHFKCLQDEGTLGSLDSEGRAAKRARRELVSSSESSGSESVTLAPLPIPPTPEEAAAASREQVRPYLHLPHVYFLPSKSINITELCPGVQNGIS